MVYIRTSDVMNNKKWLYKCIKCAKKCKLNFNVEYCDTIKLNISGKRFNVVRYYILTLLQSNSVFKGIKRIFYIMF